MKLSARNRLKEKVTAVEDVDIKVGDEVEALVKSTEIMTAK